MKSLIENNGCKFALTTSSESDRRWSHASLGGTVGGGSYPHQFCGQPVTGRGPYCAEHHARCHHGLGKDARSLEAMIYAVDQSQMRVGKIDHIEGGISAYAPTRQPDHTDGIDIEIRRETARAEGN